MEGRTIPPGTSRMVIRSCQTSRLQRQLLARAYQQICPEIRRMLPYSRGVTPMVDDTRGCSTAADVADLGEISRALGA